MKTTARPARTAATAKPAKPAAKPTSKAAVIKKLAKDCGFETLERRWSDRLDFHDVAVWNIKEALEAAYEAGRKAR